MRRRHLFSDTTALTGRSLKHVLRSPDTIVTTAIMPIGIMVLFVFVLGGALQESSGTGTYVDYQLPGIVLITVATGVSYTSYRLFQDVQGGLFERFRSMPVARSSVLWAHVLTSLVANLVSVTLVIGVALLFGFRSGAGAGSWLAVGGIVVVFTLALTWLAVIAGLSARTVDGASAFSYPLIFLPLLSSAFVPTDTMPGPVGWFAEHQPVTPIVDSIRALLDGSDAGSGILVAIAWCVGLCIAAYAVSLFVYRRRFGG
ncbi:MAG: ABC transporter permease [Galactobacter sp.]